MPDVPRHVQARGPVAAGRNLRVFYQPTNTRRDLPPVPASQKRAPMDEFLVSDDLQDTLMDVGEDMARDGAALAASEGLVSSGDYVSSFDARAGTIVEVNDGEFSNPRRSVDVLNTSDHAAAIEFGNNQVGPGRRILGRVGAQYDNPKGGE